MTDDPVPTWFQSLEHFKSRAGDVSLWQGAIHLTLNTAGLSPPDTEPVPGHNATYPTFICGDVVVKFFGYLDSWQQSHAFEQAALELVSTDREILAPELLAHGYLNDEPESGWAYIVTGRVPGQAIWRLDPDPALQERIAVELGQQIRRIHPLRSAGVARYADWSHVDVTAGVRGSSLPAHLVDQAADYVRELGASDPAFINADIVANHVYIAGGRLSGIIDWGDALIADRHIELIQIYRDLFNCDRRLFRTFLEASEWPVSDHFPRKVLGYALYRQVLMKAQHQGGGDVFEPIAEQYPLDDFATLDELANTLFDVW